MSHETDTKLGGKKMVNFIEKMVQPLIHMITGNGIK